MREVRSAFGPPSNQIGHDTEPCRYQYGSPIGLRTAEREGYVGFEIQFEQKRVVGWRLYHGNPSYEPPHWPRELKWAGKFLLVVFATVVCVAGTFRRLWRFVETNSLLKAFAKREIATDGVPIEFRFIDHDLTLREVIDRLGPPSRMQIVSVRPGQKRGADYIVGDDGGPAIAVAEYELPNESAVIVMPEYPFERENQIRAVYYRKRPSV